MKGPIGEPEALAVARGLGLDMDKLAKDMKDPEIEDGLHEVLAMADSLQINGTPSFILGDQVIVGASDLDQLRDQIASVHKCGHTTC
jgi:protein-disulfide isomerase